MSSFNVWGGEHRKLIILIILIILNQVVGPSSRLLLTLADSVSPRTEANIFPTLPQGADEDWSGDLLSGKHILCKWHTAFPPVVGCLELPVRLCASHARFHFVLLAKHDVPMFCFEQCWKSKAETPTSSNAVLDLFASIDSWLSFPTVKLLASNGLLISVSIFFFLSKESEDLERQNAALRREIKQLREELSHFSTMLNSHETHCSVFHTQPPAPSEVLYTPLSFPQTHISSPCFQHWGQRLGLGEKACKLHKA